MIGSSKIRSPWLARSTIIPGASVNDDDVLVWKNGVKATVASNKPQRLASSDGRRFHETSPSVQPIKNSGDR